ncbi:MAG: hypothetical protein HYU66_13850, partial [Armatimonadetes bacterium]|nr:hypothetical protein [Armatimonadota bacterium]
AGASPDDAGRAVYWIEVDLVTESLPKGLILLDTPGLGSLHPEHALRTQRFVLLADAVLYVLHAHEPVVDRDRVFLRQILALTPDVFFVQTKIDERLTEEWQELRARNESILRELLGPQRARPTIWPVSSTNFGEGTRAGSRAQVRVSQFEPMRAALDLFLFRVSGLGRTARALWDGLYYHTQGSNTLANRVQTQQDAFDGNREALSRRKQEREQRLRQFEADWGPNGVKKRDLGDQVREALQVAQDGFAQALAEGGDLETAQVARIQAVGSVDEARRLEKNLFTDVASAAIVEWQCAVDGAALRCTERLAPFSADVEGLAPEVDPKTSDLMQRTARLPMPTLGKSIVPKFRQAFLEGSMAVTVAGLLGAFIAPLAGVVALVAGTVLFVRGLLDAFHTELEGAKGDLTRYLAKTRQQVAAHFFHVDRKSHQRSLVKQYFDGFAAAVMAEVEGTAERLIQEAGDEADRLDQAERLEGHECRQRLQELRRQKEAWDGLFEPLSAITQELEAMERCLSPATEPGE